MASLTLVMFPSWYVYGRLARREELDATAEFGEAYTRYASATPAFIPCFSGTKKVAGDI